MSDSRTVFPLALGADGGAPGGEPLLLDGMEVLFDRTVGLYPVELEPRPPPPAPAPAHRGAKNGRSAHGNGVLH